jgi:parallel beta-helix repeat protein
MLRGNKIINNTNEGIYAEQSSEFLITNNTLSGGKIGIYLKESNDILINENTLSNHNEKAIYSFNSSEIQMENNNISTNNIGIYFQSSNAYFTNSTISDSINWDIQLSQETDLISINSTFSKDKVIVPGGCILTVKNYLHVFVQNETFAPFAQVLVEIKDGERTIYSVQTDDFGYLRFLVITDRIYVGSNNPEENETTIEVKGEYLFLLDNPRIVDMSSSHIEVFSPGNPLDVVIDSPGNQSLVFDTVNITGTSENQGGEDITVEISVDGGEWMPVNYTGDNWESWWISYDTNSLSDGEHVIYVKITSSLYTKIVSRFILVDNIGNKPPIVSITSHKQNDIVNGTITIQGTTFDYDGSVESVKIRIDNGIFQEVETMGGNWSSWSFNIDTFYFANGTHKITVMAVDNASESMTISLELIFENKKGDIPTSETDVEDEQQYLWLALIPVIFVVLLLFYVIIKRRKDKENDMDEPQDEDAKQ